MKLPFYRIDEIVDISTPIVGPRVILGKRTHIDCREQPDGSWVFYHHHQQAATEADFRHWHGEPKFHAPIYT